jgi:hypothetical protein
MIGELEKKSPGRTLEGRWPAGLGTPETPSAERTVPFWLVHTPRISFRTIFSRLNWKIITPTRTGSTDLLARNRGRPGLRGRPPTVIGEPLEGRPVRPQRLVDRHFPSADDSLWAEVLNLGTTSF